MANLESSLHGPGVKIYRAKGDLTADDLEMWRDDLVNFIKQHRDKGVCGMLIDTCHVDSVSVDSLDTLLELLADPEEVIRDVRMRFALIGVKPFTQRFLRETMPVEEVKHIRARFFHEVSEKEALAWLQAMVSSADDLPLPKPAETDPKAGKVDKPPENRAKADQPPDAGSGKKEPDVPKKETDLRSPTADLLKGSRNPAEAKPGDSSVRK
jgi:hypothetical protein